MIAKRSIGTFVLPCSHSGADALPGLFENEKARQRLRAYRASMKLGRTVALHLGVTPGATAGVLPERKPATEPERPRDFGDHALPSLQRKLVLRDGIS